MTRKYVEDYTTCKKSSKCSINVTYLKMNSELSHGMHTQKNLNKSEGKKHILETGHPRALKLEKFLFFSRLFNCKIVFIDQF